MGFINFMVFIFVFVFFGVFLMLAAVWCACTRGDK